ncbi:MAG: cupredoxin domain-containing protein [Bellilinea sp.]
MPEITTRKDRMNRKLVRQRQQQRNKIIFTGIVITVLGLAGFLLFKAFYKPALPMAENVIDVSADMAGFDKKEIRIKVGEPVTIRLRSLDTSGHTDGGGQHQWAVEELEVDIIAQPKGTAMATFTPTEPGEYTFYCDICCGGRANPTMNGKLIVEG